MKELCAVIGLVLLCGCAGRTAQPVAMINAYDGNLSCEQVQAEISGNEQKARQLIAEDNSNRNANIAIGAVGVLLFWPALFALDLSDAERIEAQALHERNTHLASLYRDCSGASPGSVQSARAIRHGAYDGKWVAEGTEDACSSPWAMQIEVRNGTAEGMLWRGKAAYNFVGSLNGEGRLEKVLAGKTEASNGIVGPRFITVNAAFKEDAAQGDYSMPAVGVGTCVVSFNLESSPGVVTRTELVAAWSAYWICCSSGLASRSWSSCSSYSDPNLDAPTPVQQTTHYCCMAHYAWRKSWAKQIVLPPPLFGALFAFLWWRDVTSRSHSPAA